MKNNNNKSDKNPKSDPNNELGLNDIKQEANNLINKFKPLDHRRVLNELLAKIPKQNFRELAGIEEDKKLSQKHLLVCSIEQLLKIAQNNNWGLCKKQGFIYLYNGAYWSQLQEDELQMFLGKAAEKMGIDHMDSAYYKFKDHLLKQFLSTAYLPEPERPKNTVFINLQNGTFEIDPQERRLKPFDRDDFITYQLPFEYDEEATAPQFQAYLDRVQPDKERQQILAEYLAYVFAKHLKLEKTLLLYGTGANGKSVFFEIVNALLGKENVTSYSLNSLTQETGCYRAKLANALVNYASEINGNLEASIFKQLVSGEPVEARLLYGQPFILNNYARLIFNCNELPKEVEHTHAYFRRFLIVPFEVTIPEEEQDKGLAQRIIDKELSGVFNWVLKGLDRLLANEKFTKSKAVQDQIEQYRRESDSVKMFMEEEGYEPSLTEFKLRKALFQAYQEYCLDNGYRATSSKTFSKRLAENGYVIERKNYGRVVFVARK